ncbi:MAG: heparan-alpha-glucosaminide N-acetyltransferase domain-containing protein [Clostridia bacterium]|nr:heparan-alpha-glucosaminide N-acetyltransferase domain-containing protein [Clostridia bacterium]
MTSVAITKPLYRNKKRRAWELDFLRGVAVIAMCFDHLMFDLAYFKSWFSNSRDVHNAVMDAIAEFARAYWNSAFGSYTGFRFWAHHLFVFLFLFLVGTSCAFSHDNTRRGALLGVVSIVFTGATFALREIGIMQYGIVFGILHCIAMCILLCAALDIITSWNKYLNKYLPLAIGVAIVAAGVLNDFWQTPWDKVFTSEHFLDYILGSRAYGDDWFGIFPNIGAVLIGMYWGKAAYPMRASLLPRLDGKWNKPITFVGRHALIVFLLHQVVLAAVWGIVCLCVGYRF